jgi:hypothetical protein
MSAAISFIEETSELRISELLNTEKVAISCENHDDQFAFAVVNLDKEDMIILRAWLLNQIEKLSPTSNG